MPIAGLTLKYSKPFYEAKITKLESYTEQLKRHLDTLEGLKNQLPSFWNDAQAQDYLLKITTQIAMVRNAMDTVDRLKQDYIKIVAQMTASTIVVDEIIGDLGTAMKIASGAAGSGSSSTGGN